MIVQILVVVANIQWRTLKAEVEKWSCVVMRKRVHDPTGCESVLVDRLIPIFLSLSFKVTKHVLGSSYKLFFFLGCTVRNRNGFIISPPPRFLRYTHGKLSKGNLKRGRTGEGSTNSSPPFFGTPE